MDFLKRFFLKLLYFVIFGIVLVQGSLALGIKQENPIITILMLALIIYIVTKKIDISERNKKPFLLRFFGEYKAPRRFLSNNDEEAEQQINTLIEQINNGEYSVDVSIKLTNETAYLHLRDAEWQEIRATIKSVSYSNISQTFKIAGGLKLKLGNLKPVAHRQSEFTKIAKGDFYVTNKRVLLVSATETKKIDLNNILNVSLFKDGILIQRDSGKSIFIPMDEDAAMVSKAIIDNA